LLKLAILDNIKDDDVIKSLSSDTLPKRSEAGYIKIIIYEN